jgi:hypothetical protein
MVARSGVALAQGDTLRRDTMVAPTAAAMPANVAGFELTPTAGAGNTYRYVHDKVDTVDVTLSPYPAGATLRTGDDTAGYVFQDADQFRYAYNQAYRSGVLSQYGVTGARTDPLHIRGVAVHGYFIQAVFKRRNAGVARYSFYDVYALPQGLVRIRAELPTYRGSTGTLLNFAHGLLDALVLH